MKRIRTLSDTNSQYERANANLQNRHDALCRYTMYLTDKLNQMAQENMSLRASGARPPQQSAFALQHPNNASRARAARLEQPRQTRVETLRESDGGLVLGGERAPPPPTARLATQAGEPRFGAVGDGRPSSSGGMKGGVEGAAVWDAQSGPGPAIAEGEEEDEQW